MKSADDSSAVTAIPISPLADAAKKSYSVRLGRDVRSLSPELGGHLERLQAALGVSLWLLIQSSSSDILDIRTYLQFRASRSELGQKPIGLVIDSPGGDAGAAYKLAKLLHRNGGYLAIVPEYAKSAATLLCLGATDILLGEGAELGPLDVQLLDPEREQFDSALNEVQSLERLQASALNSIDQAMVMLLTRTGKKVDSILPHVLTFVAAQMRPLWEKIDTVHLTSVSRDLKVGEEYATRLLREHYEKDKAEEIAVKLVQGYPEHGFIIDQDEAKEIGLLCRELTPEETEILYDLADCMRNVTAVGKFEIGEDHDASED